MSPQELKINLMQMQARSIGLIIGLTAQNKDLANLVAAIDNEDEMAFIKGMAALGKSCRNVADALSEYCDSSAFFLRGDWLDEGQAY